LKRSALRLVPTASIRPGKPVVAFWDHAVAPALPHSVRRARRRRKTMPRKPGLNSEFVMFDVVYEDGTQRSNRKVPRALTGGIDGDKPAHGFLIEQDREIAEKSGSPPAKIKSITRSGAKKKVRDYSEQRAG
jgi:hypothetical protein